MARLNDIDEHQSELFKLECELGQIKTRIAELEALRRDRQLSEDELSTYIEHIDNSIDIKKRIEQTRKKCDEVDYFANTANILYQYYNLVESGGGASDDIEMPKKANSILRYFSSFPGVQEPSVQETQHVRPPEETKTSLMDKYLTYTDEDHIRNLKSTDEAVCSSCGSKNVTLLVNDGFTFCNDCDCVEYIVIDHEKPSYREPPKEVSYYTYKRINHFKLEWKSGATVLLVVNIHPHSRRHAQIARSPIPMHESPIRGKRIMCSWVTRSQGRRRQGSETRWAWPSTNASLRYSPTWVDDTQDSPRAMSGYHKFKAKRPLRSPRRYMTKSFSRSKNNGSQIWRH